ncbi:MAG: hypothetical protein NTY68_05520 [Candidatus Micrarchaeota archaeon]|nr:hypothetical protein [Candidatus Micrarchaeota archaeon]
MQKTIRRSRKNLKPGIRKFKPESSRKDDDIFINQERSYERLLKGGRRPGILRPCVPDLIRKLDDLKYIGGPFSIPNWITPKYIANCMENEAMQQGWAPKRGDWYFDADLSSLWRVESRKEYGKPYAPPPGRDLKKSRTENGRWLWHYYLPKPLRKREFISSYPKRN